MTASRESGILPLFRNRRLAAAIAATIMVAIGLWGVTGSRTSDSRASQGGLPLFEVRQGPLRISVNVSGTIKAREQEVIKCQVEGQTTILSIIDEGERVEKGDLLLELDASKLEDLKIDQEIWVQNGEAAYITARETLEVTKNQAASDVDKARLTYQFAKEDLRKYIDGDFPKSLKEAEARITLARGTAARAQEKLEGSERLAEKDFITSSELEADQHGSLKAQLDLDLAEHDKRLLSEFTYKRQLAQLESDVHQAEMALERTERKASADVVQAEAGLKAKESEFDRQKNKLDKLEEQIGKTKIYAPAAGLVVYATSGQGSWRGNAEPLDEGQVVRERQELIHLPTGSSFMAEVEVHESSLTKIREGLPVIVTVEALPGRRFAGHVVTVAPLPDAQSVWMNPDLKVYDTEIHIDGGVDGLRTGMTCLAEILAEEYDDAVYVPVQAVVRVGGKPTVFTLAGRNPQPRRVALGLDNNRMIHILEGLKAGEHVLLTPPLAAGDESEEEPEAEVPAAGEAAGVSAPEPATRGAEAKQAKPRDAGEEQGRQGGAQDFSEMRKRFENATPEEQAAMRKRFQERMQNMTPEEREQMMQRRRGGGGSRGNRGDS